MSRIDTFLELVVKQQGSDLHLVSGNPPRVRIYGQIFPVRFRTLNAADTRDLLEEIMPPRARDTLAREGSVDFAYAVPSLARFRVNVFHHLDGIGAVFRIIHTDVRSLKHLGMPVSLINLARQRRGLVLVTGPTGSGKTTTLAAMIDQINRERAGHIVTIEDPIEYVHENRRCLVSQREVGSHVESFAKALHSALREDPDVILVGELRDLETIHLAVTAAEMGVLVLATLHTSRAAAAVDRMINVFPPGEEPYIRAALSTSLAGVISQHLLRGADGKGRVAAVEVLLNTTAVANIIREGSPDQLVNVLQSGALQGMQSMDTALRRLVDERRILGADAYRLAANKREFAQYRGDDEENPPVGRQ